MLEALIAGERDPAGLADLAKRRMRSKIPQLTEALNGRFTEHHAFLARVHLDLIDQHTAAIEQLTARIEVVIEPFRGFRDLICTIPGIGAFDRRRDRRRDRRGHEPVPHRQAPRVLGRHHARATTSPPARSSPAAPDPATPTCKAPSAPPRCRARRPATPTSAPSTAGSPSRRGPQKANVAVQHAHAHRDLEHGHHRHLYDDPGGDYFTRLHPERAKTTRDPPTRSHGLPRHPGSRLIDTTSP